MPKAMIENEILAFAIAVMALCMGGVLKGATGAGAPVIVVPILALLYDVPLAVALFTFPNLIANTWQGWSFRSARLPLRFVLAFAGGGAIGAAFGTVMLARLPADTLMGGVAVVVFVYIAFRLARPGWRLAEARATRIALPVDIFGGVLQGAGGISAPVSVTFLNAMGLTRDQFIATIAIFFVGLSLVQIPTLSWFGILTPERVLWSIAATLPIFAAMPLGAALARRLSRETFDKIVLALLAIIALRMLAGALL